MVRKANLNTAMKLSEAFAKRKTYDRPNEIRVTSLKNALEEYDKIVGHPHYWDGHLWAEIRETVKTHIEDYPDDDPLYWTYTTTISFLKHYLEKSFEKM